MKDEIKEIDITKDLYLCSPLLNTECSKENCYINNGSCCHTVIKEHSQQYLLDYITNLQEENERYKIAYENVMIANKMLDEKYKDYKTRNEKAIERATHIQKNYGYELSDLIFLLQGSDS